ASACCATRPPAGSSRTRSSGRTATGAASTTCSSTTSRWFPTRLTRTPVFSLSARASRRPSRNRSSHGRISTGSSTSRQRPSSPRSTPATASAAHPMNPDRRARYQACASGPDIAAFIDAFELRGMQPTSVENYENDLARLPEMFPDLPLDQVTDAELAQLFRTFPIKGRRPRVAKFYTFFKWARRTRRIVDNPMDMFDPIPRQPRKQYDIFSDAETQALLELDTVDAAPLALLFDAGLRRDEFRAMTLRHCNPTGDGFVNVINGKGGKHRQIPMTNRLRHRLTDLSILDGLA